MKMSRIFVHTSYNLYTLAFIIHIEHNNKLFSQMNFQRRQNF